MWSEQVSNIIKSFATSNGILFVNCRGIQEEIIPNLNSIFKQLVKMVGDDVSRLSEEVLHLVEKLLQVFYSNLTNSAVFLTSIYIAYYGFGRQREHV